MEAWIPLVGAGVLALLLGAAITPLIAGVARRRGWFDRPNARKVHQEPIPRLGGVGIFVAFLVSALAWTLLGPSLFPGSWTPVFTLRALVAVAAVAIMSGVGLVDDFSNLPALLKLGLQIAAAALVTVGGYVVPLAGSGSSLAVRILAWVLTMGWLVGVTNAVNLVDGMDGLAGGFACIASLSLGATALLHGNAPVAVIAAALLGAVGGFLIFNFPPARIFMGDSGSYLLGFSLALIPLMGARGTASLGFLLAPLIVLSLPILDTFAAIARRAGRRLPLHTPDKEHIHHVLLALGLKEKTILAVLYGYCACLGAAAVGASIAGRGAAVAITAVAWAVNIALYMVLRNRGKLVMTEASRQAAVLRAKRERAVAARRASLPRR
jgi:UDP-GlcNAc:undecaprenyl-phosphate/decaprenyl-phosphate GlcNAc-1-phosphate transferase